jgi:hypothetical protein
MNVIDSPSVKPLVNFKYSLWNKMELRILQKCGEVGSVSCSCMQRDCIEYEWEEFELEPAGFVAINCKVSASCNDSNHADLVLLVVRDRADFELSTVPVEALVEALRLHKVHADYMCLVVPSCPVLSAMACSCTPGAASKLLPQLPLDLEPRIERIVRLHLSLPLVTYSRSTSRLRPRLGDK